LKNFLLNQSLAVRTNVLPEVKKVVDAVPVDFSSVRPYKTNIKEWLKPVIDLEEFYVYPTNGITEGLNWWYHTDIRSVSIEVGDYQWIKPRNTQEPYIKYQSVPSSIDGNFRRVCTQSPVALDLAYVGSTKVQKIEIDKNVEYVFYSLSKSFGVRNVRTGWIFTRDQDIRLEALTHNAKYYNYLANDVSETIISNFDIDYIHSKLYREQLDVCNQLGLTPSDSVWLATTQDAEYEKFRRQGSTARICLAGVYNEKT
jgi:hypothetical protein